MLHTVRRALVYTLLISAIVGATITDVHAFGHKHGGRRSGCSGSCYSSGCNSGCSYGYDGGCGDYGSYSDSCGGGCGYGDSYGCGSGCSDGGYYGDGYAYDSYSTYSDGGVTYADSESYVPTVDAGMSGSDSTKAPALNATPAKKVSEEIPPQTRAKSPAEANIATFVVSVPQDAKIFFGERATTTAGSERHYTCRVPAGATKYTHLVRAEVVRKGQLIQETKAVEFQAGQDVRVAFDFESNHAITSKLTLNVPADAKVTLAGHQKPGTGVVREFTTQLLAAGQEFPQVTIVVALEKDGQTLTQERTVSLKGGETGSLTFDFADVRVAAR